MDDEMFDSLKHLPEVQEQKPKRKVCDRCKRPTSVCWCSFLPDPRLETKSTVYVWQHPYEQKRPLSTTPMLKEGLGPSKCHIWIGRHLSEGKFPKVREILESPNTILLWPSPDSIDVSELDKDVPYNIILIDGTWFQARSLYKSHEDCFRNIRKVQVSSDKLSKYLIRTQPSDNCFSTLETGALTLSILQNEPKIYEELTRPLDALCQFQIDHGATKHDSKQSQENLYELPYEGYGRRKGSGKPKWLRLLKETASLKLKDQPDADENEDKSDDLTN
ncbi:DgyrCDS12689 [Dimorphilus gyrociliatus]|uniref:tRNA-uridine aminocarboxypropyltransferase n=1 Tax=Dimorphilus gyrociliatus TaxID=2664684 RepID=A0A7I8W7A2_9ANNE|nr:DgyrCDS12689 [Dimorphilus gyrociliatus]